MAVFSDNHNNSPGVRGSGFIMPYIYEYASIYALEFRTVWWRDVQCGLAYSEVCTFVPSCCGAGNTAHNLMLHRKTLCQVFEHCPRTLLRTTHPIRMCCSIRFQGIEHVSIYYITNISQTED